MEKQKLSSRLFFLAVLVGGVVFLGGVSTAFATTPTISNVSGTVATGNTLTITGANMQNESKAGWTSFFATDYPNAWSFEGSDPKSDGYSLTRGGATNIGVYDSTVKLIGNKSIRFHVQGYSEGFNLGDYSSFVPGSMNWTNEFWARAYVRWNATGGWPSSHIKMWYFWVKDVPLLLQPCQTPDDLLPTCMTMGHVETIGGGNISHNVSIPWGRLQNNRWYVMEAHYKAGNPALLEFWMDGVKIYQTNKIPSSTFEQAVLFGLVNLAGTPSNFVLDHWFDGQAFANTRIYPSSTVEIANSSNYTTATKRYQEPLYISDGSIQIKADLSGLGSGPYYLFVTNNRQERSAGFALSGGGGGGDPVPTASLTANPTSITSGQSSTLTWSSTNSTSCLGTNFSTGGKVSGTTTVSPTATTTYKVDCSGAGGTANASATVTVNTSTFAYTLSNGGAKSVTPGGSVSQTVTATLSSGSAQPVSFSVSGLPAGASLSFPSCTPTCTSTGTIATTSSTPAGTYTVTITGSPNSVTTSFPLTVGSGEGGASGLLAAYNFDEGTGTTLTDRSGNGNNGNLSSPTWTTGKYGGALAFDGANDSVSLGTPATLSLGNTLTVSAWVKRNTNHLGTLYRHGDVNTSPYVEYGLGSLADGKMEFIVGTTTGLKKLATTGALSNTTWHHIAATWDGTTQKIYVDGVLNNSLANASSKQELNNLTTLGHSPVWGQYWNGALDDVRIYNKALTQAEIQTDMNTPVGEVTAGTPCHRLTPGSTVPAGFSPPWNVFTNTLLLQARCHSDSTVTFTGGDTLATTYLWHQAYYTQNGTTWETPVTLQASQKTPDGKWVIGSGSFTTPALTSTQLTTPNHFVAYACTYRNNQWFCGCKDQASCTASGLWSVQEFRK